MKKFSDISAFDLTAVLGLASLLFGIWQIHHPSAWIVGGLLVCPYSILASVGWGKRREDK